MIIKRYLYREIFHTFCAVVLVVLLIAISNKLVRLVGQAASGMIPPSVLLQVIFYQIPDLVAFLLPVGLFLAVLLCYSRFFADNEIPVMLACGISWQRLMAVSVSIGLFIMILSGSLTCYWGPTIAQYREHLLRAEGPLLLVQTVAPGRFHSFHRDKLVLYVADLNSDRTELKRIFIAEDPKGNAEPSEHWSFVTASRGNVVTDDRGLTYFKLQDGLRYDGTPGEADYSVLKFDQYQRLLEETSLKEGMYFHRTMPTQMLFDQPSPGNLAELQWRLSIPLSAPLLALLAVPLSRVSPRTGRFGRMFVAILICIIYFNLLTVSKRWVASGILSPIIGVWWVHLLLLCFGLIFLAKASGRWDQFYQRVFRLKS